MAAILTLNAAKGKDLAHRRLVLQTNIGPKLVAVKGEAGGALR